MPTTNLNSAYVSTGKPNVAGSVFIAPLSTALPTDATTTLNSAFVSLGYISEDGVSNDISASSEDIKEWGGATVGAEQTEKNDKFKMTFIEALNPEVLKLVFGDSNVTVASGGAVTIKANATAPVAHSFVIEMVMTNNKAKRIAIPNAKITEISEIVYKANEAVGYEVTLTAFPNSSNDTHYEYIVG